MDTISFEQPSVLPHIRNNGKDEPINSIDLVVEARFLCYFFVVGLPLLVPFRPFPGLLREAGPH